MDWRTPSKSLIETSRKSGEAVQNLDLFTRAWDECIELECTPRAEWVGTTLLSLQRLDRIEFAVHNGETVVGGIILAWDVDIHVGECLSVFAQYVLPEFRNQSVSSMCMRAALRTAREVGARTLAYTHRQGPWRYSTIYRRIT